MVALGIGCIHASSVSQYQYAFILEAHSQLNVSKPIEVFDPVMDSVAIWLSLDRIGRRRDCLLLSQHNSHCERDGEEGCQRTNSLFHATLQFRLVGMERIWNADTTRCFGVIGAPPSRM